MDGDKDIERGDEDAVGAGGGWGPLWPSELKIKTKGAVCGRPFIIQFVTVPAPSLDSAQRARPQLAQQALTVADSSLALVPPGSAVLLTVSFSNLIAVNFCLLFFPLCSRF